MAELDPRLLPVLDAVMRSPLAPLGTIALERLEAADGNRLSEDGDRDPLAPPPEESDTERAYRQLEILDTVIGGRLRLELELLERSQYLAREIASRPGARGFESFATVVVMPDAAGFQARVGRSSEDLLSGARRVQLGRTLKAWQSAVGIAGSSIGESLER